MNDWGYSLIIAAAIFAIAGYFVSWLFSAAIIVVLFVMLIFVYESEKNTEAIESSRKHMFNSFSYKLDTFYDKIEETKKDLTKHMFALQSRHQEMNRETTDEIERNFREFAGKMLQIENSLNKLKRFLQYEDQI
ncbi:MAG: hypothetical protein HY513_05775 [Candidatus Aenigmarchaeota archaeon]|nr:hypothetical protein [Candidatus Aenigmarchaeota archaeon]